MLHMQKSKMYYQLHVPISKAVIEMFLTCSQSSVRLCENMGDSFLDLSHVSMQPKFQKGTLVFKLNVNSRGMPLEQKQPARCNWSV